MSRTQAKSSLTLPQFKETMKEIFTISVNKDTLDEIIKNVADTVDIIDNIKPIYNFKAAE